MTPPDRGPASGRGLLDARALWASIVGPQRLAMGAKQSFVLSSAQATKIGDNIARADAYVLIGVTAQKLLEPAIVLFSKDDALGGGSSFPYVVGSFGVGIQPPVLHLLLPGEQLFAQLDPALAPVGARIVVSQVTF